MNEADIKSKYEQDIPAFRAWGLFVQNSIITFLQEKVDVNTFLKIPALEPRIKSIDSLLAKALHRNKNYSSPYDDITDKVGIRFVVLLTSDISQITNVIDANKDILWHASKDKDYDKERESSPEHFTYESVHYVVYSINEVEYDGVQIPANTPCEIQIRTLLQHAYAEMSHDTIYKPQVSAHPKVKRFMARSMALVESADHFFVDVKNEIDKNSEIYQNLSDLCSEYYLIKAGHELDTNANVYLIDQLIPLFHDVKLDDIRSFLEEHKFILVSRINLKLEISWIYRQPAILLVYYLIRRKREALTRHWPLTLDLLHLLFSDMGVAVPQN